MKFSIVTLRFNKEYCICDCIESVRVQSETDWEQLGIDAGSQGATHLPNVSSAGTIQRCNEAPKFVELLRRYIVMNYHFRKATGDWLVWLNSDDYPLPRGLAKVVAC